MFNDKKSPTRVDSQKLLKKKKIASSRWSRSLSYAHGPIEMVSKDARLSKTHGELSIHEALRLLKHLLYSPWSGNN